MCRGNRREAIFEDDRDRKCFVDTLAQASKRAASIVREESAVKVSWLTEKLHMGSVANVTRATKAITQRLPSDRKLKRVKKKILATISS